jgi:hypothetical protein
VLLAGEEQQERVAAELEQAAAPAYATSSRRANTRFITSVTSSAPTLPFCASRSDMAVKPEMSTKTSVPSSSRRRASARRAASR